MRVLKTQLQDTMLLGCIEGANMWYEIAVCDYAAEGECTRNAKLLVCERDNPHQPVLILLQSLSLHPAVTMLYNSNLHWADVLLELRRIGLLCIHKAAARPILLLSQTCMTAECFLLLLFILSTYAVL